MFKVGDRVKIRKWDDMVDEFGLNCWYDISLGSEDFIAEMRPLCGKVATILNIISDEVELDFEDKSVDVDWRYTIDMIEEV